MPPHPAAGKGAYAARIALDSIEIRNKHRTDRIRPTSVSLHTDSATTRAEAASGDLSLTFSTPQSADSLIAALTRAPGRWPDRSTRRASTWSN